MATNSISPQISASSHTLSFQAMPEPFPTQQQLLATLADSQHAFLQPSLELQNAALSLAKQYLDPLALNISDLQTQKLKERRRKRKRGDEDEAFKRPLQLKKVHLEGFKVEQVWEQARRVLDAAREELEVVLPDILGESLSANTKATPKAITNGLGLGMPHGEDFELSSLGEESSNAGLELNSDDEESLEDATSSVKGLDSGSDDEQQDEGTKEDIMDDGNDDTEESEHETQEPETFVPDPNGLNDGFFSIDDFNRHSEFLEQVDARGDPDDGAASDEEDVDWGIDPLSLGANSSRSAPRSNDEKSDDEDDEEGPTFGNMDLQAPEGESDDEAVEEDEEMDMDGPSDVSNANNVMYSDFFAPPARKGGKRGGKRGRPMAHNFPSKDNSGSTGDQKDEDEADIKHTMQAVHRDLFSDEEEEADDPDESLSDLDPSDPRSRRSTHERRQAKLLSEIRKLEAENVAKRSWTLSGEARAADRPLNSLLEEDLEFERAGKPVPVITQEVSEDVEALIKRRILAQEFDEVLRRRPDELLAGPMGRRGRINYEVEDTKSKKGLAELYEEDHLRKSDPNFVEVRDEKLKAEHREIENMWKDISSKLDSLCSWHYKPKPVEMSVQVRSDAPAVSMEDARPSGVGGEVATTTQLAPQEVYRPGEENPKDEIVTKGGEVVKRDELSREQKLRRRRREKERARKAGGNAAPSESKKSKERKEVVGNLKKGGVTVIGRKGEMMDVEGNAVKSGKRAMTAGAFKL